ncbi:MAG: glycosyl hydrolase 2 galactose-binding domain-containing protein [Gemmatimonadaceae bacterium]
MAVKCAPLLAAGDIRTPLAAGWELLRAEPGSLCAPEAPPLAGGTWLQAIVPGTVASSLQAAGMWSPSAADPLDAHDWWYRCRFSWKRDGSRVSLALDGLATIADVWLNGAGILHSENMFVRNECDVTSVLRDDNELVICFASLESVLATKRPRGRWRSKLVDAQGLRWLRTTLLGRIPAWSATPRTIGPWREIALIRHGVVSVENCQLNTRAHGNTGVVEAMVRVRVADNVGVLAATLTTLAAAEPMCIERDGKSLILRGTLTVPEAALWWPHTHGAQPLYDVSIQLHCDTGPLSLRLGRVGFRSIELDTRDGNFAFTVNGVAVFCRGACWSTVDPVALMGTREQYRAALTLARDGGMNMIRVGGTMVYEADAFYELCDELGILVWQDFMFANMDYPDSDIAFLDSVKEEVCQTIERLGDHASLALVCGNSEVEQQAAMLGLPRQCWSNALFGEIIPSLVAERCPGLAYWPSSPSGGTFPFHANAGDAHYFGHGPYLRPMSDVRASGVRFASETLALANVPEPAMVDSLSCGSAGAGHHPVWKSGVPRDNGAGWDFEDVRDHHVATLFNVDPLAERYLDPERYLTLGRVAGGEMIASTLGEWRRAASGCNGALVWLYRDLVPGAGWGLLGADGRPKAAYYYFRRASLPVAAFLTDEGLNGIVVHVANDTPAVVEAELRVTLYRAGNTIVGEGARSLTLQPATTIALPAEELLPGFADISFAYRFGAPSHQVVAVTLVSAITRERISDAFHFPLGLPYVTGEISMSATATQVDDDSYELTVRTDSVATAVAIDVRGFVPDDNYFHLQPATDRVVLLRRAEASARFAGSVQALNAAASTRIEVR